MHIKRIYFTIAIALLIVGATAMLGGCKGSQGPIGPAGESSVLQLEGFAANINCGDCHNTDTDTTNYVWAKKYQWELSKHFYGGDFERNSTPCSGCHTTEGYVQRMLRGNPPYTSTAWAGVVTTHIDASPPGCFACHSPHSNGDFRRRTEAPVTPYSPLTTPIATLDFGKGNTCLSCHQPRSMSPLLPAKPAATDSLTITNNRWYPHYGVQGMMLSGQAGFEFPGYTYTGNSAHSTLPAIKQEGCTVCHMADAAAGSGIAGGHTMNVSYTNTSGVLAWNTKGCLTSGCHATMPSVDDYISAASSLTGGMGARKYIAASLDSLAKELVKKKYIDSTNTITATTSKPLKIPVTKAGALYNFLFLEHDMSNGVHNTRYAVELVKSSLIEIRKP